MSYVVVDGTGRYVGELCSGSGLEALYRDLTASRNPWLAGLARLGYTLEPRVVAAELRAAARRPGANAQLLDRLAALLDRCEESALITSAYQEE